MELPPSLESPQSIAEQIERLIRVRTGGTIRGLRVQVGDEGVVLSGRTTTYYNKQLATHGARAALGELPLVNDIDVC